jgi:hypothetical protein
MGLVPSCNRAQGSLPAKRPVGPTHSTSARFPADQTVDGHAALIELSELDWSKAKLSRQGRDGSADIGVIAR